MKTKVVYAVASTPEKIYMEQAIISAWSLRYHNRQAHIVLVCDQDTRLLLDSGWQNEYLCLFDDVKVCKFNATQSRMERSRWMKTNLRSIVSGDFLFLDADTIVCRDLSIVDHFTFDLGFVLDNNCTFDKFLIHDGIVSLMRKCYNMDVSKEKEYFNSGVFYAKDTEIAHTFFTKWHENWRYEITHIDSMKDQQPLMKTNIEMGHVITEMDGILNCQIVASIRHLHNAAIIHIYNHFNGRDSSLTPFHSIDTYLKIKKEGFTKEWKNKVLNFRELFSSPSFLLGEDNALFWRKLNEDSDILWASKNLMICKKKYPLLYLFLRKAITFLSQFL